MLSYDSNTAVLLLPNSRTSATVCLWTLGAAAMLKEFRAFIAKGNVLDLAVAVIIGAAFAKIASSLTEDIIMPVVGAIFGGLDFSSYFTLLGPVPAGYHGSMKDYAALKAAGAPVLGWGEFVTVAINFVILAFIIFLLVRWAARLMTRRDEPAAPAGPSEVELLTEIRDELRKR
jgi:large conductance mechanosensitive channel